MRDTRKLLTLYCILITVVALIFAGSYLRLRVQHLYARQQIADLDELTERATRADRSSAVGLLEAIVGFYPEGTRFEKGSNVGWFVEKARSRCAAQIIAYLRKISNEDLGEEPEKWIKASR